VPQQPLGAAPFAVPKASAGLTFSIALTPKFAAVKSATVTVIAAGGSPSAPTLLKCTPSACSGAIAPPSGIDAFAVTLYGGTGGTGTALASGSLTRAITAATKALGVTFGAPPASLSLALSKSSLTVGVAARIDVLFAALDAKGNAILGPYVNAAATAVHVALTDSDGTGATKLSAATLSGSTAAPPTIAYDGAAIPPISIVASASGVASASATLTFAMTAAEITSALSGVEAAYLKLPHTSVEDDLRALVAQMIASKTFASATVAEGGIDGAFPNGTHALLFADHPEDLAGTFDESRPAANRPSDAPIGPSTAHEIAFLVNEVDVRPGIGPFYPEHQQAFRSAFMADGFTLANGYGVDTLDVTLENIAALGAGHPLDFLDIATHGMVSNREYYWLSTTTLSDETVARYFPDIFAGRLVVAGALQYVKKTELGFAFTADFLKAHLRFNPGAIVDNQSCFGQSASIYFGPRALADVGVGRYLGWTRSVRGDYADESDAFMLDRILGEQSPSVTGLDQYAGQRTPPQRPFPLDDVYKVMYTENRHSPLIPWQETEFPYAVSPRNGKPLSPRVDSYFVVSDFGGEKLPNAPIEYDLPSIERVAVDEPNLSLHVYGSFPSEPGTVTIGSALDSETVKPSSWTSSEVDAPIAKSAYGAVSVTSGGITSNTVPLTQWNAVLTFSANGSQSDTTGGSGSYAMGATFDVGIRSDVHPTVETIDTTPAPQSLAANGVELDTPGKMTSLSGGFSEAGYSATFSLQESPPEMLADEVNQANYFEFVAPDVQLAGCNNGMPGPGSDNPYSFCTYLFFQDYGLRCSGDDYVCTMFNGAPIGNYTSTQPSVGFPKAVMDPKTYALTVPKTTISYSGSPWGLSSGSGTATISGTVSPPLATPAPVQTSAITPSKARRTAKHRTAVSSTAMAPSSARRSVVEKMESFSE
jgi:hypothetical protein